MNLMQGKGDRIIREVRDTSGRSEISSAEDELKKYRIN